jgi:hypothetical protein
MSVKYRFKNPLNGASPARRPLKHGGVRGFLVTQTTGQAPDRPGQGGDACPRDGCERSVPTGRMSSSGISVSTVAPVLSSRPVIGPSGARPADFNS